MKLLDIFYETKKGNQVSIDQIDESEIDNQIHELLDTLYADSEITLLIILEEKPNVLKELAKGSDRCMSACAAITLLNEKLPELGLASYV